MISVIIPSYNSWPLIGRTLYSLEKQNFKGEFEIIVADSSSDNSNVEISANFPKIKLIHSEKRLFPGAARNRAIDESKGSIIAMIDADAEASDNWLSTIDLNFKKDPQSAGFGGAIENTRDHITAARIAHLLEFGGYTQAWKRRKVRMAPACNLALKREIFDYARFFEEWFGNEDVLLAKKIETLGKEIIFDPEMVVFHNTRDTWKSIYEHQYNLGRDTGRCRTRFNVDGSWLARKPGASYLIPMIKYMLLLKRVIGPDRRYALDFISLTPVIIIALNRFASGFREGIHLEHV
jgi:glycosyltransferase involved in cell wall biosynthesis